MKLEKVTHDHLLTKWLKVIIFSILMLAPIISVAVRCAYVVCNKNAYQSYSNNERQTSTELATNLEGNLRYQISTSGNVATVTTSTYVEVNEIYLSTVNSSYQTWFNNNVQNIKYFNLVLGSGDKTYIYYYNNELIQMDYWGFSYPYVNLVFIPNNHVELNNNNVIYEVNKIQSNYLDNVFDYSISQLNQDQIFNWTQNTAVYTGVNAMCTGLGMSDGTISILITYWTLLSIIYVIIDIVLEGFVALTHMILKKAS